MARSKARWPPILCTSTDSASVCKGFSGTICQQKTICNQQQSHKMMLCNNNNNNNTQHKRTETTLLGMLFELEMPICPKLPEHDNGKLSKKLLKNLKAERDAEQAIRTAVGEAGGLLYGRATAGEAPVTGTEAHHIWLRGISRLDDGVSRFNCR